MLFWDSCHIDLSLSFTHSSPSAPLDSVWMKLNVFTRSGILDRWAIELKGVKRRSCLGIGIRLNDTSILAISYMMPSTYSCATEDRLCSNMTLTDPILSWVSLSDLGGRSPFLYDPRLISAVVDVVLLAWQLKGVSQRREARGQ